MVRARQTFGVNLGGSDRLSSKEYLWRQFMTKPWNEDFGVEDQLEVLKGMWKEYIYLGGASRDIEAMFKVINTIDRNLKSLAMEAYTESYKYTSNTLKRSPYFEEFIATLIMKWKGLVYGKRALMEGQGSNSLYEEPSVGN